MTHCVAMSGLGLGLGSWSGVRKPEAPTTHVPLTRPTYTWRWGRSFLPCVLAHQLTSHLRCDVGVPRDVVFELKLAQAERPLLQLGEDLVLAGRQHARLL
eukprot:scaffold12532_cov48-Phaeocystis_antarctica.AAC.2